MPGKVRHPQFKWDELLANVILNWNAGPNTASWYYASWYYISFLDGKGARKFQDGRRIEVPVGFLIPPNDTSPPPPGSVLQQSYNVVRRTDAPTGGHFAALEQPELFIGDVRSFVRACRGSESQSVRSPWQVDADISSHSQINYRIGTEIQHARSLVHQER